MGYGSGPLINSFFAGYDSSLIATTSGVKRFGNFDGKMGDSHSNVHFGSSGYTGDDNLVITGMNH